MKRDKKQHGGVPHLPSGEKGTGDIEFGRYRIVQDRLFQSDFDKFLGALPFEEDDSENKG